MSYRSFDFCVFLDIEVLENFDGGEATLEEGFSIAEERTDAALPPPPPPPPAITPSPADALPEPGPSGLNQQGRASRVTRPSKYHKIVTCLLQNMETCIQYWFQ